MTLPEKLAAMSANFESGGPPHNLPKSVFVPMHKATQELIDSGAADRALKAGERAPEFTLKDADGKDHYSKALLANSPLVLTFYRGVWCPYCNAELQALQEALPQIEQQGGRLIAISPQTAPNSRRSQRENKLTFPILSDPENKVAEQFGLRFTLPDYLLEHYREVFKNDLSIVNGDKSGSLPMPARYVIGMDGVIAYAEVNPDYTNRPDPSDLLPTLKQLHRAVA